MSENKEFQERTARIERLVHTLESAPDSGVRASAQELVQVVMELHAAGLDRIMETLAGEGTEGARIIERLARDSLVSSLLVLHDLHPDAFETRVHQGLEKARPVLRSHGASLELMEAGPELVRVKIIGSATQDLKSVVRNALYETAPDAVVVVIEGEVQPLQSGFVPLKTLLTNSAPVLAGDPANL